MIERALVVGGGPAGMTAAIALARRGVSCEIVECSHDWRPEGVGLALRNSPLRALHDLGLLDACIEAGFGHEAMSFCNAAGDVYARVGAEPLVPGPPILTISRQALHEILQAALRDAGVPVRLGTTITTLAQDPDGVDVELSDRSSGRYDLVLGADGIHSQMRARHFPNAAEPVFTGQTTWRAGARTPASVDAYYILTNGLLHVGLVPISADRMYVWLGEPSQERVPREQMRDYLLERLAGFGPLVQESAAAIEDDEIDGRALQTVLVQSPWHVGRLLLVGDAAHSTTPQLAYGIGIAIEDAVVLAELVGQGLEGEALGEAFVARRFERCKLVVEASAQMSRWEIEPPEDPMARVRLTQHALEVLDQPI